MSATCKSCRAPIVWGTTQYAGKRVPLDPPEKRYVRLHEGVDVGRLQLVDTWLSHFATCPSASKHRRTS